MTSTSRARKVKMVPLDDILSLDDVDLDEATVAALEESLVKEGLREPLVLSTDGTVLHGNHRLEAARRAGLAKIECVIERDVSGKDGMALRESQIIAENHVRRIPTAEEKSRNLAKLVKLRKARMSRPENKRPKKSAKSKEFIRKHADKPKPGRPKSPTREAIRHVAKQKRVSEDTVERAVKKHALEELAPRVAKRRVETRPELWGLFEKKLKEAEGHLLKAQRSIAPLLEPWGKGNGQCQKMLRVRESIQSSKLSVQGHIPGAICVWCEGKGGRDCGACHGLHFTSEEFAKRSTGGPIR